MDTAFEYLKTAKLMTEADYPYKATDGKCKYASAKGKVGVSGFVDVPRNNPE
jgi:KDEL-tailed cysteine endopeptidase